MSENIRKLVTVRTIDALTPIEGADLIEAASIEGWTVVVKKGEFQIGDKCVYIELDSFLPDGVPAWQFLVDKSSRTFEGVKGHKVRTMKLKGIISQGFVLPLKAVPEITDLSRDVDQSELLGIVKWEATLAACLQGQALGMFPSWIRKTDQERAANCLSDIFGYDPITYPVDVSTFTSQTVQSLVSNGILLQDASGSYYKVMPAKASREDRYEITLKIDGSSMTVFGRTKYIEVQTEDGFGCRTEVQSGVCSRNLELKINDENSGNSFVSMAVKSGLLGVLERLVSEGIEIAVQGELMSEGIQGNREKFTSPKFFVFDIFNIKTQEYMAPEERMTMFERIKGMGADINHAPVLHNNVTLFELGLCDINTLNAFAEGPSINNPVREGVVFKRMDGKFSFKSISQKFLLKEQD